MKTKFANLFKITLALCAIMLLSNSCTEKKYEEIYIDNPTKWGVYEFTVNEGDWKWDKNERYFYYEFSAKELTSAIVNDGVVLAYLKVNSNEYKSLENTEYFHSNNGTFLYTETTNFIYGKGFIQFRLQASYAFGEVFNGYEPKTMIFKVTTLY